jgi:aminoglycoside 6-adenylyltransferase
MKQFEERIIAWAEMQPNIRTILVVGSRARRDHPADEWADLDLQTFATDFGEYLSCTDWLDDLGTVWMCIPFQRWGGEPERLAVFEGGYKVDFHFFRVDELGQMVQTQTLDDVYQRGYHVLVDKDDLAVQLPPSPFAPPPADKPTENDFILTVKEFWYDVLFQAKTIRRRDLWFVKGGDGHLKNVLLKMIEWHAHATHGWEYDTWHAGKFILEWTDSQTREALNNVFGHFDAADSWRALLASIDLFRRLATETASQLGYVYPTTLDKNVTQYVNRLYEEDDLLK